VDITVEFRRDPLITVAISDYPNRFDLFVANSLGGIEPFTTSENEQFRAKEI